jgi:hypothetical protein
VLENIRIILKDLIFIFLIGLDVVVLFMDNYQASMAVSLLFISLLMLSKSKN